MCRIFVNRGTRLSFNYLSSPGYYGCGTRIRLTGDSTSIISCLPAAQSLEVSPGRIVLVEILRTNDAGAVNSDYCYSVEIIGAGSAGSVIADRISANDPRINILLIEAGEPETGRRESPLIDIPSLHPMLINSSVDWGYLSVPQRHAGLGFNNRRIPLPQGKVSGGSFSINGLIYQRGSRHIYDAWEAMGATGWGFKDILKYFRRSEDISVPELMKSTYHKTCGPLRVSRLAPSPLLNIYIDAAGELGYPVINCNEGLDEGICRVQTNIKDGRRWTTLDGFTRNAIGRQNVDMVTDAHVLISKRKALGIEFIHRGIAFKVRATREIILTAGPYGTPQILLRSGIGPPNQLNRFKIPPIAFLPVGENLQDHAVLGIRVLVKVPTIKPNPMSDIIKMNQYLFQRKGLMAELGGTEAILTMNTKQTKGPEKYPNLQIEFKSTLPDHDPGALRIANKRSDLLDNWFTLARLKDGIYLVLKPLHPKSRGNIKLGGTDIKDTPFIDPQYLSNNEDLDEFVNGIRVIQRLLKTSVFKKMGASLGPTFSGCMNHPRDSDEYWRCFIKHFVESGNNPVGTAKMGAVNDNTTVVGPDLKVKEIEGLRVADSSVIPEITDYVNAATIMIAERAAEFIKADAKNAKKAR
ncbi:hypothetical protein FSP39_020172 [Pinctada imbricata]|uniref:Glucose-methanol-choline oxidoreductase N-terminal domain-containing protein n=1 Tax=Pinctada imbricata TaxID=66713 RepID=A0AA89C438_PINIB|nr:hypothetical protein FSP39_020172 [Pinctada imbricata]